jgi:hypothetical protein
MPHVLSRPNGVEEHHLKADYYVCYRSDGQKVWENVGNSLSGATRALEKKCTGLAYIAAGGTVPGIENKMPDRRTNLGGAIEEWLEIIKEKFSGDSWRAKKLVLDEFLQFYWMPSIPRIVGTSESIGDLEKPQLAVRTVRIDMLDNRLSLRVPVVQTQGGSRTHLQVNAGVIERGEAARRAAGAARVPESPRLKGSSG